MESLGGQSYSRKEKSLGLLVTNFLNMYNREGVNLIGIDVAARNLGVERRRIYDVVNILESIGVVARSGKNQYSWRGFGEVPRALDALKEAGMRENYGIGPNVNNSEMVLQEARMREVYGIVPCANNSEMVLYDQVKEEPLNLTPDGQEISPSPKTGGRKEKCLWMLSQNFVKLFVCSNVDLITFDDATNALLNESQDNMNMRTKVRRLYDIANVFSSMNLIKKTQCPVSRKPAYRWLGANGISAIFPYVPESLCGRNEPKKRAFGTEITNVSTKRSKTDSYGNENTSGKIEQGQDVAKPEVKSFVSGPVTPANTSEQNNNIGINNTGRTLADLERLSSFYRPQYCNPGILDLLGHFSQTWKTWNEQAGKK